MNRRDIKKAIDGLVRKGNKTFYFQKNCFAILHPSEVGTVPKILSVLYDRYMEDIKVNPDRITGLTYAKIGEMTGLNHYTISLTIWKLTPIFVNQQSNYIYGKCIRNPRYTSLTENGRELYEAILEAKLKEADKREEEENV